MPQVQGKFEIQTSDGSANTITLDGDNGTISSGGDVRVYDNAGKEKVRLGAESSSAISAQDASAKPFLDISDFGSPLTGGGGLCRVSLGADKDSGGDKAGQMALRDSTGNDSIFLNGKEHRIHLRDNDGREAIALVGDSGIIDLRDKVGEQSIALDGSAHEVILRDKTGTTSILVKGDDPWSRILIRDKAGKNSIRVADRLIRMYDERDIETINLDAHNKRIYFRNSVGRFTISLDGEFASIVLRNASGESIVLDGDSGDIRLNNADCAEDFDISEVRDAEPGTVMVLNDAGVLRSSNQAYDKKVAGIVSGAGNHKPALVLDKKPSQPKNRMPIALMGKAYCKVDAAYSPIEVGDLLTTSSTPGHAMKAVDPVRAFGAVIGKALRPLNVGQGIIPILVALQ